MSRVWRKISHADTALSLFSGLTGKNIGWSLLFSIAMSVWSYFTALPGPVVVVVGLVSFLAMWEVTERGGPLSLIDKVSKNRFPDIRVNDKTWAVEYWPDYGSERCVILRQVRIANNEDDPVNIRPELKLIPVDYGPSITLGPATSPPSWDSKTGRDMLPENLHITPEKPTTGYMTFPIPALRQRFARIMDPDKKPRLFNCVLEFEDIDTGVTEQFEIDNVLLNK